MDREQTPLERYESRWDKPFEIGSIAGRPGYKFETLAAAKANASAALCSGETHIAVPIYQLVAIVEPVVETVTAEDPGDCWVDYADEDAK